MEFERKDKVRRLDENEGDEHRRRHQFAVLAQDEPLTFSDRRNGDEAGNPRTARGATLLDEVPFRTLAEQQAHGRDEQQRGEWINDPVEALEEIDAEPDHDGSHDQRADDTQKKNPVLLMGWNPQLGKDQDEHEDVVHG